MPEPEGGREFTKKFVFNLRQQDQELTINLNTLAIEPHYMHESNPDGHAMTSLIKLTSDMPVFVGQSTRLIRKSS
jgi:hypothetical protein